MAKVDVELVKAWGMHAVGAKLALDSPIADLLIQQGRAQIVKPEEPASPRPKPKLQSWVKKPEGA